MTGLVISNADARRLFLDRHALAERPSHGMTHEQLLALILRLGFVQLDSINVLERAHHLILFSRAPGYARELLSELHQEHGSLFEHWTHDASLVPIAFYPHWHHRFRSARTRLSDPNWLARFDGDPDSAIRRVRRRIRREGALAARAFEDKGHGSWWGWGPSKAALEYLWRTGELAVARRAGFEKVYDLSERVIADEFRTARPTRRQTVDWACNAALARLGFATPGEIAGFFDIVEPAEARAWTKTALRKKQIVDVCVGGANGEIRPALAHPSVEADIASLKPPPGAARFLSPFDPAIRDRRRAKWLFGFDYTIEVYVPQNKRRYGYYVLPILEGERFIGRADLKAHRPEGRIEVKGIWPEPDVTFDKHRHAAVDAALAELTRFSASTSSLPRERSGANGRAARIKQT